MYFNKLFIYDVVNNTFLNKLYNFLNFNVDLCIITKFVVSNANIGISKLSDENYNIFTQFFNCFT